MKRVQARFQLGHVGERLVPALLEFAGNEAVLRVHGIELTLCSSGLIPRLFQRQFERLAFRRVVVERVIHRVQGRLQTDRLDRVESVAAVDAR